MPSRSRRYPIEPLERLIRARLLDRGAQAGTKPIAAELGEDPNTIRRARTNGLQRDAAERLAEAAGYLPYEVWPEILDHDVEDRLKVCAAEDCDETFAGSYRQKYCSVTCRNRQKVRRWRRSEKGRAAINRHRRKPEVAEVLRARRRAYYAENGEYERARQRIYDAAKRADRRVA